VADQALMDAPE